MRVNVGAMIRIFGVMHMKKGSVDQRQEQGGHGLPGNSSSHGTILFESQSEVNRAFYIHSFQPFPYFNAANIFVACS